jgi:hypothetical protein
MRSHQEDGICCEQGGNFFISKPTINPYSGFIPSLLKGDMQNITETKVVMNLVCWLADMRKKFVPSSSILYVWVHLLGVQEMETRCLRLCEVLGHSLGPSIAK